MNFKLQYRCFILCALVQNLTGMSFNSQSLPSASNVAYSRKVIPVFCTIKNFKSLYKKNDKSVIALFLKFYFERISEFIISNGGHINKYVGETVFAVFDVSSSSLFFSNLAEEVLNPFRFIFSFLDEINNSFKDIVNLELCVGMDIGDVMNGVIGYQHFHENAFIGDIVNTASRLKDLCFVKDENIIVSATLLRYLPRYVSRMFNDLGPIELKGKSKVVFSYGYKHDQSEFVCSRDIINERNLNKKIPISYHEATQKIFYEKYIILCCDIRNFTTFCESYNNCPLLVFDFLKNYFNSLISISLSSGGTIYKLLGDEIIVLFPVSRVQDYPHKIVDVLNCGFEFLNIAKKLRVENGVGIAIGQGLLFDTGSKFFERPNPLCNSVLISGALKRAAYLQDLNKSSAIKKFLSKNIIISKPAYDVLPVTYKKFFGKIVNPFNKNIIAWGCKSDPFLQQFPHIDKKCEKKNKIITTADSISLV